MVDTAVPFLTENNRARDKYKKPEALLENPDAIVIGSGIGGMSIASLLAQKKKWKVLLLEGNKVPGGCTHNHELEGFEWPSGIDSIGDMDASIGRGINRPTIDYVTGGALDWAKMPDVHEICHYNDGKDEYRWFSSSEKNIEWLGEKFSGEGDKVRRYYELAAARVDPPVDARGLLQDLRWQVAQIYVPKNRTRLSQSAGYVRQADVAVLLHVRQPRGHTGELALRLPRGQPLSLQIRGLLPRRRLGPDCRVHHPSHRGRRRPGGGRLQSATDPGGRQHRCRCRSRPEPALERVIAA